MRRRKQLLDELKEERGRERMLETERGSTRSHSVERPLCERLWNCRKIENGINDNTIQFV